MYFNGIPNQFGQATAQDATDFIDRPFMGYTQGIGGLPAQQQNTPAPSAPAPQLANIGNASTAGNAAKSLAPLPPKQPLPQGFGRPLGQSYADGGIVSQTLDKGGIVSAGIAALRGQHPNPRSALDAYDKTFGPEATSELIRAYADGGIVNGPGSGVADLVPGSIDGREDVRIASGEYVIPAWAVATLGDGSTEAGAAVLDDMVARLREAGSENIMGSEPIAPNDYLPA